MNTGDKLTVAISEDEIGSVNALARIACSSTEYTPATPSPKPAAQQRLPFEDDPSRPALYRSTGSAVTIGDSAIQNPTVARGIMLSSMLPVDRHCYDRMTDIPQALDRASQHYAGLSLVRRVGELHYEVLDKKEKAHELTLYQLQRENDKLKRQIKDFHAKSREADNALNLMRKQRDRASLKLKDLEVMFLFLPMLKRSLMASMICTTTRKRSNTVKSSCLRFFRIFSVILLRLAYELRHPV